MGLLTDPDKRDKFLNVLSKYNNFLCWPLYIIGFLWFLALAHPELNNETYFSENALLPGVVEGYFSKGEEIKTFAKELLSELKKDKQKIPKKWLYTKFTEVGLETFVQNFTVAYPLNLLPDGQKVEGQNVYGILRAQRAASTEALVISAPFRPLLNPQPKTHVGIALMLSLAKYMSQEPFWAKDIIFLVTDQDAMGMQAWLKAYHGYTSSLYLDSSDISARGGSIQAAINLEIGSVSISHMNINIQGLNGQLPNLDFVNLAIKLCRMEGIRPMLHRRLDTKRPNTVNGYKHSLITMLTMMGQQASGAPSGNHGLFHKYNIEAITLEGVTKKGASANINSVGRIMEGILRSLNNLLERFHQSFFFYLLMSTNRYVSIGVYMPPFGVMLVSLLIKAISLWLEARKYTVKKDENEPVTKSVSKNDSVAPDTDKGTESDSHKPTRDGDQTSSTDEDVTDLEQSPFYQFTPVWVICIFIGVIMYYSPSWLASSSRSFRLPVDDALLFGMLAIFLGSLSLANMLNTMSEDGKQVQWETFKSIAIVVISLILGAISLINISLAFFMASTLIPVALSVKPRNRKLFKRIQQTLLLLTSPPVLLLYATFIYCIYNANTSMKDIQGSPLSFLSNSFFTFKRAVFLEILDYNMMGNITHPIMCLAVLPSWLLFWTLARI